MIELKSIYKSFDEKDVLIDINARFENGKTNLIIGQSGSGKTALMSISTSLSSNDLYMDFSSIIITIKDGLKLNRRRESVRYS